MVYISSTYMNKHTASREGNSKKIIISYILTKLIVVDKTSTGEVILIPKGHKENDWC